MSVVGTDMDLKYSVSAAAGNTTAGTQLTSLGDQVSTTSIPTSGANVQYDDVSSAEALAGDTEYRCFFVCNNNATDPALNVTITVQAGPTRGAVAVAADVTGVTVKGLGSAQALTVANENTAPASITGSFASSAALGTIPAGSVAGFWVRRTISASTAALTLDGDTLRIGGDG
jgi:hypothetical protein